MQRFVQRSLRSAISPMTLVETRERRAPQQSGTASFCWPSQGSTEPFFQPRTAAEGHPSQTGRRSHLFPWQEPPMSLLRRLSLFCSSFAHSFGELWRHH